jgi:hypothetical protein
MDKNKNISTEEKKELVDKFNLTIAKVVEVFGTEKAFRDLTLDSGKVNRAIADFIMLSFAKIQEDELIKKREDIKQLLVRLLSEKDFKKSISQRTSDTSVINYRIDYWFKELKNVVQF